MARQASPPGADLAGELVGWCALQDASDEQGGRDPDEQGEAEREGSARGGLATLCGVLARPVAIDDTMLVGQGR